MSSKYNSFNIKRKLFALYKVFDKLIACYKIFVFGLLLKMFQDLEPQSVFVKIIEYSLAGKSFLTSDIWEKILSKNRNSALKKFLKSISTFKVGLIALF